MRARMNKRATIEHRIDDTIEVHKKRYQDFVDQSGPIIAFYEAKGVYQKVRARQRALSTPDFHQINCDGDMQDAYTNVLQHVAVSKTCRTNAWLLRLSSRPCLEPLSHPCKILLRNIDRL